jgi:ABC-2 type transport system ATP-binding protein
VLLTTHYLEEADALADRVLVMRRGQVIADDSPAGLRVRAGLSDVSRLEDAFVALTSDAVTSPGTATRFRS